MAVSQKVGVDGGGWTLVRRVKAGPCWHPATDDLKGTAVYGTYSDDITADRTFSKAFSQVDFDQFLFASGLSCPDSEEFERAYEMIMLIQTTLVFLNIHLRRSSVLDDHEKD